MAPDRVKIERSRICHVAARVVRHDGDVIAYFVLARIALLRIKRNAHCHIGRPGEAGIGAVRIEQLRINIVCSVPRVVPNSIQTSIRCDCKCAKPVPFIRSRVVVDLVWRAEG